MARIRSIDDRDYYLGGIKLDRADVEKDLVILVSHNLSWNNHVDVISDLKMRDNIKSPFLLISSLLFFSTCTNST